MAGMVTISRVHERLALTGLVLLGIVAWSLIQATSVRSAETMLVAADGSGDHMSISDALAAAQDGDAILVGPGRYAEALLIDKSVALAGEGDGEGVIIAGDGLVGPLLTIRDSDATVSNVTLTGPEANIHIVGGAPVLRGLLIDSLGNTFTSDEACHALYGPTACHAVSIDLEGTDATVSGSVLRDSGQVRVHGGGSPVIEGNDLSAGAHIFLEVFGDATTVRGNSIRDAEHAAIAIYASGRPLIEGNTIAGSGTSGIEVGLHLEPGIEPTIRGNSFNDNPTGVEVASGALPTIEGNTFDGNASAIVIAGGDAVVQGNRFTDNASGVFVMRGSPVLDGNEITGGNVGLGLGSEAATPTLIDNRICDVATSINLIFGAEMPDVEGNEICDAKVD